jgi:hypothetical protein
MPWRFFPNLLHNFEPITEEEVDRRIHAEADNSQISQITQIIFESLVGDARRHLECLVAKLFRH